MTSSLEPIPTPLAVRWREFRTKALPVCVFGAGVVVAAALWQHSVAAPTLVAEAESVRAEVATAQGGWLEAQDVALFDRVSAGQVVGSVRAADPHRLEAALAVVQAELELLRTSYDPAQQQQRAVLDYERLRLDWMKERVTLASLRAQLIQAGSDVVRLTALRRSSLVSEEDYDAAVNLKNGLEAQVAEQADLVEKIAPCVVAFGTDGGGVPRSVDQTLRAAIDVQTAKLELIEAELGPVPLRAPIDGVVVAIHRYRGEAVRAAEPIMTIVGERSDRLVGFLRQPLPMQPAPGMHVELRTRSAPRRSASATVSEIGSIMEPISPTILAATNRAGSFDTGLRLHIAVPAELEFRPGEQVDVILRP